MKIVVHGCSMTALVTAVSLAANGRRVLLRCGETDPAVFECSGRLPFEEPGLTDAIATQTREGRLLLAGDEVPFAGGASVHFLALGQDELRRAETLVDRIAAEQGDVLLVNQVNYGVGVTNAFLDRMIAVRGTDRSAGRTAVAAFPDFLQRGTALENFSHPDRLVIGVDDPWAEGVLRDVLRPSTGGDAPVHAMPARDAEFTKQAVSGMLATRLSYMNDMAKVADELGIDINNVRTGIGSDDRVGPHFLQAGCGFGGTGFYNDLLSLKSTLAEAGVASRLVDTAMDVNEEQKDLLFRKLWKHYRGDLKGRTVALWGVSFKPDTDRVDFAPSLVVIDALLAQGVIVRVHDPKALPQLRDRFPDEGRIVECEDPYEAAEGADALLLLTEWQVYHGADAGTLRRCMAAPLLLDGRNIYDPVQWRAAGFAYYGVGRR
jgi:UDPglucose 6-dehydrogenase